MSNRTKEMAEQRLTVIDSDRYADAGIETMVFPGGEPHVKVPRFTNDVLLWLKLRSWSDVGFAALLMDALDRQRMDDPQFKIFRFIPYFPGARQDRTDGRSPLTVHVMQNLLLDGFPNRASVFDPHSPALVNEARITKFYMPADLNLPAKSGVAGVISPDKGAAIRAEQFRARFYPNAELLQCEKTRDFQSGQLTGFAMPALPRPGHYIIVDDICDGGGTFNLLAEAFEKDPIAKLSTLELFVSHGIFSKGLEAISPSITKITTTDSWCRLPESERLSIIPLLSHVEGDVRARFHNSN